MSSPFVEGGAEPCTAEKCEPFYIREWETMIVGAIIVMVLLYMFASSAGSYFADRVGFNYADSGSNRFGTRDDRAGQDDNSIFDYVANGIKSAFAPEMPLATPSAFPPEANPVYANIKAYRAARAAEEAAKSSFRSGGKTNAKPPAGTRAASAGVPPSVKSSYFGGLPKVRQTSGFLDKLNQSPLTQIAETMPGRAYMTSGPSIEKFIDFDKVDGIDSLQVGEPIPTHQPETSEQQLADAAGVEVF
jgi:hypothetical protein